MMSPHLYFAIPRFIIQVNGNFTPAMLSKSPSLSPRSLSACPRPGIRSARTCRCGCRGASTCSCCCCAHASSFSRARSLHSSATSTPTPACPASTPSTRISSLRPQSRSIATFYFNTRSYTFNPQSLHSPSRPIPPLPLTYSPLIDARLVSTMANEYKLKDISSFEALRPNQKIECEVEGISEAKVLLLKLGNEVHALNPRCTHYGAPLKNGVVSPDGRLTCPWHGGR